MIERQPELLSLYALRGDAYFLQGDWRAAAADYARSPPDSPTVEAAERRIAVFERTGQWAAAAEWFDTLREGDSQRRPVRESRVWWVVGPYAGGLAKAGPPEGQMGLLAPPAEVECSDASADTPEHTWTTKEVPRGGYLDFHTMFGAEFASVYALTRVYAFQAHETAALVGSDDGVRLWVNGELVHHRDRHRAAARDQDACLVNLRAGWNTLLFKVANDDGAHGLFFRMSEDPISLGRALAAAGQVERANRLLTAPDDDPALLRKAGYAKVSLGRWKEASHDFAQMLQRAAPTDCWDWFQIAVVLAAGDDKETYRTHCQAMLQRYRDTRDATTADVVAKSCLVLPNALDDLTLPTRLAEFALRSSTSDAGRKWRQLGHGLSAYRNGQFAAAIDSCRNCRDGVTHSKDCAALIIEAMSCRQLEQIERARSLLREAQAMLDTHGPAFDGSDDVADWRDWLVADVLRKEAEAMFAERGKENAVADEES